MNENLIRKFFSGPLSDLFIFHGDSPELCPSFTQHANWHSMNPMVTVVKRSLSLQEAFGQ